MRKLPAKPPDEDEDDDELTTEHDKEPEARIVTTEEDVRWGSLTVKSD